jgi:uncharacterized membrane protein YhaH (DUF805 family)
MSKPVFEDAFKFSGRRNRQSYIMMLLAQLASLFVLALLAVGAVALIGSAPFIGYIVALAVLAGFIAVCVSGWAVGTQRIRDFGHSGVWMLAILIPYVGWILSLAICFIPSSAGENKYGPSCI